MPWSYNQGSGTPPSYTYSALNTYNQHAAPISLTNGWAITKLKVYAAGYSGSVSTRLALWQAGGNNLAQSSTFTMASGSTSVGGQYWYEKDITPYKITSSTTYWVGLYRNPSGGHIFGVESSSGNGYRKTNTSGFPAISSMSGYSTHSGREPHIAVFYITSPDPVTSQSASRVSDNQLTVSFTNNHSTDQPYTSLYIERWDNITGSYYNLATIGSPTSSSSYTDNTTVANRYYKYRIRAWNAAGYSSYAETNYVNTTPAAPSSVTATRSGSNVELTWSDNSNNEDQFRIQKRESTDEGATWGSWGSDDTVALGNESYTDTSPYTYGQYRIRAEETTQSLYSSYVESNEVVTLAAPNAPTGLNPNGTYFDADLDKTFYWTHNPTDSTDQTKFSLRYRESGDAWPGTPQLEEESSTNEYHEFLLSSTPVFTNGTNYEWQTATWGDYATESDWSDTATFSCYETPIGTVTNPTEVGDYGYSELTVTWTYTQGDGLSQSQYLCKLYDENDTLLESKQVSSTVTSGNSGTCTFDYTLSNSIDYKVTLKTQSTTSGIWSAISEVEFTTSFQQPPIPIITTAFNPSSASVSIAIVNPSAGVGEADTSYNDIYRSIDGGETYELALTNIPINTTTTDYVPLLNSDNYYYALAVSEVPSSIASTPVSIDCSLTGAYIFNSEANYSNHIVLTGNNSLSEKIERENKVIQFEGRTYPVKYQGTSISQTLTFSSDLSLSNYDTLVDIIQYTGDIMYRDYLGRRFTCNINNATFNKIETGHAYQFSCNIERVEEE